MYIFLRSLLFLLDPEVSHTLSLRALQFLYRIRCIRFVSSPSSSPCTVMGVTFKNRVGLAAGLDKNGEYIDALSALGFGFIEIGTITPKPQSGNPKPRLFRLPEAQAIINRMGFNSKGADYVANQLKKTTFHGVLGINIGKNKETSNEKAVDDYLTCMRTLAPFATYFTINLSSPNTEGLRALQQKEYLSPLLRALKQEQKTILNSQKKYIPLVVKLSPDLSEDALRECAHILLEEKIDGVIATNTTLSREGVESSPLAHEAGGLSGQPLTEKSTKAICVLREVLQDRLPIIASGGVMDAKTAKEKIKAGASLVQVYTGFIYSGPNIIYSTVTDLAKFLG